MAGEIQAENGKMSSFGPIYSFLRRCLFRVISVGPLPNHIAFIMDGNRRYAKKKNIEMKDGYRAGALNLMTIFKYCYELKIRYVSVYAFSIDNFKRQPEEVEFLMKLIEEKIEGLLEEESIINEFGLRVIFIGNLNLLEEEIRVKALRAMEATANNTNAILQIFVAYTATDEIVHAVEQCCQDRWRASAGEKKIDVAEIEKRMYLSMAPEPDILVRTSGQKRLSNFILWQTQSCILHSLSVFWPELGLWHLVWVLLNFQRHHKYLEKKRKQS